MTTTRPVPLASRQPWWVVTAAVVATFYLGVLWDLAAPAAAAVLSSTILRHHKLARRAVIVIGALFLLHFFILLDPFHWSVEQRTRRF